MKTLDALHHLTPEQREKFLDMLADLGVKLPRGAWEQVAAAVASAIDETQKP